MDSLLGSTFTEIFFVANLENDPPTQKIDKFSFYCRFMDDKSILYNGHTDLIETLERFNVTPSIKFTYEEENTDGIAIQDVVLTRRIDGSLGRKLPELANV